MSCDVMYCHVWCGVVFCSVTEMHNKELLYELLEGSSGGISEFILPLVVNGHFGGGGGGVTWLHQGWADQFPIGTSTFLVGDNAEGVSGVTSLCSYYLDEGLTYSKDELSHCVEVRLRSCHDDYFDFNSDASASESEDASEDASEVCGSGKRGGWILDICLDYFTVTNPHFIEVEVALKEHSGPPSFLNQLTDMFRTVRFRSYNFQADETETETGTETGMSDRGTYGYGYTLAQSRIERDEFEELIAELLKFDGTENEDYRSKIRAKFLTLFDIDDSLDDSHPAVKFVDGLEFVPLEVKTVVLGIGNH
jgi:hypothetical protein